ncbi:MAG: hypothetical protein GX837_06710 [Methanomicrobiales archaeon]|jgi:hypothetical protein|nr:hypothetical protein [Methanomicrobiales archaeon]
MILDDVTQDALEKLIADDLRHAAVDTVSIVVDENGAIRVDELTLRTEDGRYLSVGDVRLEVYTEHDGWHKADVMTDYRDDLADALAPPWRPGDDADRPEDRI